MKSDWAPYNNDRIASHPVRGAWIEIPRWGWRSTIFGSHPVRGAWIEIGRKHIYLFAGGVAPREGCVD